jgi:hypothetical protein
MPTRAQIEAAANTLDSLAKGQWIALIRGSAEYRDQPGLYPDLEGTLDAVTALQAQQLNAALDLIDEVGDGTVELAGGEDGVDYSQDRDRNALISYGLRVLYDQPLRKPAVSAGLMNSPLTGQAVTLGRCCPICYSTLTGCGHYWF